MNNPRYYDGYTEYFPDYDNSWPRLCDDEGGLEAVREKESYIPWVCVEGYKTSPSKDKIKKLLTKHFCECGRIVQIHVPYDNMSCAYIYLAGKGSSQKAVDLTGTEVRGRKIVVSFANLPLNPGLSSTHWLYGSGTTFPGAAFVSHRPMNNTITYCAEPKNFPLPTFGSGTTFPAYISDRPWNNTITDCSPYGNTLPGQRIVAASLPAYISDRPWNNTITDCSPYGNTLPGQRIVADPKNLPCTFCIGSTVPAGSSKKAEKMTEE